MGDELAASEFSRREHDSRDAAVAGRRRPRVEPAAGVGARSGSPQENPGGQSGGAVRFLNREQSESV